MGGRHGRVVVLVCLSLMVLPCLSLPYLAVLTGMMVEAIIYSLQTRVPSEVRLGREVSRGRMPITCRCCCEYYLGCIQYHCIYSSYSRSHFSKDLASDVDIVQLLACLYALTVIVDHSSLAHSQASVKEGRTRNNSTIQ